MENIITVEGSRKELDEFIEKHYMEDGRIDFSTFESDYSYLNQIYDVNLISEFRFAHLQELYFTPKQRPSMISIYYIGNREGPGLFYSLLDMYPNLKFNYYAYFDEAEDSWWIDCDGEEHERWPSIEDFCDEFGFEYLDDDEENW